MFCKQAPFVWIILLAKVFYYYTTVNHISEENIVKKSKKSLWRLRDKDMLACFVEDSNI
jgi:hypothetical protein